MTRLSDWRINFFDLGAYTGEETALFLRQMESVREGRDVPVICAYLFEAQGAYVAYLRKRFADDPRVFIHHAAIGSKEDRSYLYVGKNPECHSLYPDKHDVGKGACWAVPEIRFSEWFDSVAMRSKNDHTVNLIKANIEGAEWDLIQDMEATDLFPLFDVFLGTDQWTTDMRKCHSLLSKVAVARDILDRHGIETKSYCCGTSNYPMTVPCTDLAVEVRRVMEERSLVLA